MGIRERIDVVLGLDNKGFLASLSAVRSEVAAADGFMGKLKAGTKGLGDSFSAAAKNPAVMGAAIAAVGKEVYDLAGGYADLGVEIGKFSDATGASTEDAGRFIEVANDLGISVGTMESAIGRMNKKMAESPELFKRLKITTTDLAGGQLSAKDSFINTLGALSKMDERARAMNGSQIFGKGWQAAAELVGMGADKVKERLDGVSDNKAFSEAEVAKAREYRDELDNISDAADDAKLVLGKMAVDGLLPVVKLLGQVQNASGPLQSVLEDLKFALDIGTNPINVFNTLSDTFDHLTETGAVNYSVLGDLEHGLKRTYSSAEAAADATEHMGLTNSEATLYVKHMRDAVRDSNTALEAASRLAGEAAAANKKYQDSITELYNAQRSIIDGTVEYQRSIEDTKSALADLQTVTKDHKSTQDEVRSSTEAAYDAIIKQSEGYATLEGASLDSTGGTQRQIDALQMVAQTVAPGSPLRSQLDQYIWQLAQLQKTITTKVVLQLEQSGNIGSLHDSVVHTGQYGGGADGDPSTPERMRLRTQSRSGNISQVFTPGGSTVEDASKAAEIAVDLTNTVDDAEVIAAQRKLERGETDIQSVIDLVERKRALAQDQFGYESDQETALYRLRKQLSDQQQSDLDAAAKAAADAVAKSEKAQQDAIAKTTDELNRKKAAMVEEADAHADLLDAIDAQAAAQKELSDAEVASYLTGVNKKASNDDRAAAADRLAKAQKALTDTTIAGAKAQARDAGLTGYDAAQNVADQLRQYIAGHGDPTGGLGRELARNSVGAPGFVGGTANVTLNINLPPGANGDSVVNSISEFVSRNGPGSLKSILGITG